MKKLLLPILLMVGLPLWAVIKPYFQVGVPYTHDGENHLARFANYKIALKEGQLPPRFAPNLNNHYGYPVFNYNYPLANILSLPFSVLGISYELTFKLLMITALLLGSWGVWSWLKELRLGNKQGRFLAVASFLLAPFTVNLIYVRGNIGEAWALALFPWLLWLTLQIKKESYLPYLVSTSLMTAFLLSHNISVLFGGIIWLIYSWVILQNNRVVWSRLLWRGGLALALSLWFWLPALLEKNQIILDEAGLSNQFVNHFPSVLQLISSPLQFGFSLISPVDTMSLAIGWSGLVALVLGTILASKIKAKTLKKKYLWLAVLLSWGLVFLQTEFSLALWKSLPLVQFIQFPWRLSLFLIVLVLPLLAELVAYQRIFKYLLIVILGSQLLMVMRFQPADYLHKTTLDYDLFAQSTTTANENLPKTFTYQNIADWSAAPRVLQGQADYQVQHWTGTNRQYTLTVTAKALIVEPTMYFVGWQTELNDQLIDYAEPTETDGRIGYWLEPGDYQVKSQFTQRTWPRRLGNAVSIIAGSIFLWLAVHEVVNLKKK
ncbi:MAG: hypothetical protein ACOZAK_02260 [Patescibacteria group bacterium]